MGEGGGNIGMLNSSEVPEPPEIESRVRERGIGKGEVPRGQVKRVGSRGAHCRARSKSERR